MRAPASRYIVAFIWNSSLWSTAVRPGDSVAEITRECSALWGEPERATEVCCRLSSTVENGALSLIFRRTRSFAWCRDSVIGERFEVYVRA